LTGFFWGHGPLKENEMTKKHPRTAAVHAGTRRSQYGELSEAMFLTQGFVYPTAEAAEARFVSLGEDEFIYARYGNPTVRMFEERIAAIEGTEDAFATASGMAAVNGAVMAGLKAGDHIVAARALFGSCLYILDDILPRFGVEVTLIDGTDLNAWKEALRPDTKMAFFETVSNPALEVIDIAAVSKLAHAVGAYVVVDNVFSTPVFSDAVAQGADVVVYSATKHIDGQGRVLGGVVLGSREYIRKTLEPYLKHTGGALSPFNAWTLLKGLETMDLRVRAQTQSALEIAKVLEGDTRLERVIYPGLPSHPQHDICMKQLGAGGTVLAIDVRAGKDASYAMLNALEVFTISNNLGDAKSIVTPPAFTTHQRLPQEQKDALGITEGLVRISVGLEHTGDLIADLEQALGKI
jgi:O-succinylhomoserine sulfhydrylase